MCQNCSTSKLRLRDALQNPDKSVVPRLEEYQLFKRINKSKKPNSSVEGNLPKQIVQEFSCELTTPVTIIFKSVLAAFQHPRQWVIEHQIPLPKVTPPASEDELRNISARCLSPSSLT